MTAGEIISLVAVSLSIVTALFGGLNLRLFNHNQIHLSY
jgi:hypothetical protein